MPVRSATLADVGAVVAIHRRALAHDVTPAMGPAFLSRFYGRLLASGDDELLVASDGDAVCGFCALAMRPPPLRAVLRPNDLVTFSRNLIRSPRLLASAVVQARHPAVADWDRSAEIAFIAVEKQHAGKGHGTELARVATAAAHRRAKRTVITKTANSQLADFYERSFGAAVIARFSVAGSTFSVLEWPATEAT